MGKILYGENIIRGNIIWGNCQKFKLKRGWLNSQRQPWLCCNSHQRGPRVSSAHFFLPSHQFIVIIIRNRPCRHRTDSASDDKLLLFASEHYWLNPDWHWQRHKLRKVDQIWISTNSNVLPSAESRAKYHPEGEFSCDIAWLSGIL